MGSGKRLTAWWLCVVDSALEEYQWIHVIGVGRAADTQHLPQKSGRRQKWQGDGHRAFVPVGALICNDCLVPVSLLGVCSFFKRASASWIDVLSSFFDQSCLTACEAKNRPLEKSLSSSAAERFVWGTVKHRLIEEQSCVLLSLV